MKTNKLYYLLSLIISLLGYCCNSNLIKIPESRRINEMQVIYLKIERGFSSREIESIKETFSEFNRSLGLNHRIVAVQFDSQVYDLTVENTELDLLTTDLGRHVGGNVIRLATNRMSSQHQVKMVFMHEFGHWLGMQHICNGSEPQERWDECSVVGNGPAIMNPYNNPTMAAVFTELDRREFILHRRR